MHAEGDYRAALEAYEAAFAAVPGRGRPGARRLGRRGPSAGSGGGCSASGPSTRGGPAQASALLERAGDERAEGWVRYEEARRGSDLDAQRRLYLEAIDLAARAGDADLECDATASLGMMLVFSGLVEEGMAHLDQALAAICGGGVRELPVVEGCLCGLLNACERTHDVDRAEQWLGAAEEVIRRGNLAGRGRLLPGALRRDPDHRRAVGRRRRPSCCGRWSCSTVAPRCASRRCAGSPTCACGRDAPRTPPCCSTGLDHHEDAVRAAGAAAPRAGRSRRWRSS